jgi:hypothetical protein
VSIATKYGLMRHVGALTVRCFDRRINSVPGLRFVRDIQCDSSHAVTVLAQNIREMMRIARSCHHPMGGVELDSAKVRRELGNRERDAPL